MHHLADRCENSVLELLHGVRHAPVHILGVGPASMHDRAGNSFEINVLRVAGQAPTAGAKEFKGLAIKC